MNTTSDRLSPTRLRDDDRVLPSGRWTVDVARSAAKFTVSELGFRHVHGSLPVTAGWVEVDDAGGPVAGCGSLSAVGILTDNRKRDNDLQKPRFLNASSYPEMCWTAERFETSHAGWLVHGRLDGRGTSTSLDLTAEVGESQADGSRVVRLCGALDRRSLGIKAPPFLIGHRIELAVELLLHPPAR